MNCNVCDGGPNGHRFDCPVLNVRKDVLTVDYTVVGDVKMIEDKNFARVFPCTGMQISPSDLCSTIADFKIEGHIDAHKPMKIAVPGGGLVDIVAVLAQHDGTFILVAEA